MAYKFRFYVSADKKNDLAFACALEKLAEFSLNVFALYQTADSHSDNFADEKRGYDKSQDFLSAMAKLRRQVKLHPEYVICLLNLEQIYEILLSMAQLYFRVQDRSTLAVAHQEFASLSVSVYSILNSFSRYMTGDNVIAEEMDSLAESIRLFEEVNHIALSVVALDPMIFLLFNQDLLALEKVLIDLRENLINLE